MVIFAQLSSKCNIMNLRVKDICKQKGLLMEDLANKLGITRITLTRNINGNPTVETLEKIATALDVSITELFEPPATDVITCPKCGTKFKMED